MMMRHAAGSSGGGGITMNCQDCGNQAKKDCPYMRCRTCCKSQLGFHCETHVKSTWVPAARRRQKQHHLEQEQQELTLGGGGDNYYSKRPRDHNNPAASSTSLASTRLVSTSSGSDMGGNFPPELNSPAVFRCVRVSTAIEEEEDQYAYQTAVNVGGHVFKGILYDQGPDSNPLSAIGGVGESFGGVSGGGAHHHHLQQKPLDLITASATTTTTYPHAYSTPENAFIAGTQLFPPPRP